MTDAGPYWGNSNIVPRNISREWEDIHRERDELRGEVERLRKIERAARDVLTMSHLKEHAGCGPACIWRRLETACQR
jgi:hypothetical protein